MRILCAVDGSHASQIALDAMGTLYGPHADEVIILHVVDTSPFRGLRAVGPTGRTRVAKARAALDRTASELLRRATGAVGVTVARFFGDSVRGSMSYTYGRSWREPTRPEAQSELAALGLRDGNFHDLAARLETVIEGTDTRVVAYYRLNRMAPDNEEGPAAELTHTRFDVQLSQGLPFLGALTRADWDFLLAVRNVFYETSEGALMDEVAVTNPPKRVLGGISVRF